MSSSPVTLVWFRQDLRLADNPAVAAALARGGAVIPVFIRDDAAEGEWRPGMASRWWLQQSLSALEADLRARGGRLWLGRGDSGTVIETLARTARVTAVYWNRRYEPHARAQEDVLAARWREQGVEAASFNAALLHEPTTVLNRQGGPFQVFGPFWRTCLARDVAPPGPAAPARWPSPAVWPGGLSVEELELAPLGEGSAGWAAKWTPGEAGARSTLRRFVRHGLGEYDHARDFPATPGTSRLSPHLHFGEIGPRQVWAAVKAVGQDQGVFPAHNAARVFLSELGWREFAYQLLYHFPDTVAQPKRKEFRRFPWREDPHGERLAAWQRGATGYPIVDAGLRELRATGWMHNRVRMIVASFLVKHLRLPWPRGAEWFWEGLVDADLANNTLGWQWSAGCGADAAPYFRIFNPMTQGKRFDPTGSYVKRWIPELAKLSPPWIHAPWTAAPDALAAAGVQLGRDYPWPVVAHETARAEALAAYQSLRS